MNDFCICQQLCHPVAVLTINKYISKTRSYQWINTKCPRVTIVIKNEYILGGNVECEARRCVRLWGEEEEQSLYLVRHCRSVCLHWDMMKNEKYRIQKAGFCCLPQWRVELGRKNSGHQCCRILVYLFNIQHANYTDDRIVLNQGKPPNKHSLTKWKTNIISHNNDNQQQTTKQTK